MDDGTKCFSVNLTSDQVERLRTAKEASGKGQGQLLAEAMGEGLRHASFFLRGKTLYLVKVRIDTALLMELAQKLQTKELSTDSMLFTYCMKDDPTIGTSLWIAEDRSHFDTLLEPYRKYYTEVLAIEEVTTSEESKRALISRLTRLETP